MTKLRLYCYKYELYSRSFKQYTNKTSHMQLCGRTLDNLEVFVNNVDGKPNGTLYWLLNQTVTVFGGRALKQWIRQPLTDIRYSRQ